MQVLLAWHGGHNLKRVVAFSLLNRLFAVIDEEEGVDHTDKGAFLNGSAGRKT